MGYENYQYLYLFSFWSSFTLKCHHVVTIGLVVFSSYPLHPCVGWREFISREREAKQAKGIYVCRWVYIRTNIGLVLHPQGYYLIYSQCHSLLTHFHMPFPCASPTLKVGTKGVAPEGT